MGRSGFQPAMLSISTPLSGAGAGNYYLRLAAEDYYAVEKPGLWFGHGAQALGLTGLVKGSQLTHLLSGCSPDGKTPLVQNARDPGRQSGWDLTFSAPKSVSVFWALAPPEIQRQVEAIHLHAMETVLSYLERNCALTRRGKGGRILEEAAAAFAIFEHITSRAQDPALHGHALVMNLALRQDGTTGTLLSHPIFSMKMALGAMYRTALSAGLSKELGLKIERDRVGFHIAGVPRQLCREWSKRRCAVERTLQERGETGAVAAKRATLDTRPRKDRTPRSQLFDRWQRVAQNFGWSTPQAVALMQGAEKAPILQDRLTHEIQTAVAALPESRRTLSHIVRAGAQVATQLGADVHALLDTLNEVVARLKPQLANPVQVEWRRVFDRVPWEPARGQLIYSAPYRPFPHAPWSRAREFELPRLAVELPRLRRGKSKPFQRTWGRIHWKRDLVFGELRVQDRTLFPNAPKWSPVHGLSIKSLRLTTQKSKPLESVQDLERDFPRTALQDRKEKPRPKRARKQVRDRDQAKERDWGHSH